MKTFADQLLLPRRAHNIEKCHQSWIIFISFRSVIRIISQSEVTGLITPRQLNLCLWAWIDRMKNRVFPYITRLNTTNLCFGAFNSTPFNAFASSDHKSNSCLQLSYPNNATKVKRKFYWFNEKVFSKIRPALVALLSP